MLKIILSIKFREIIIKYTKANFSNNISFSNYCSNVLIVYTIFSVICASSMNAVMVKNGRKVKKKLVFFVSCINQMHILIYIWIKQ